MPNHKATFKMLRKDAKRRKRNIAMKSQVRTLKKKVRKAVEDNNQEEATKFLRLAVSAFDTAAKKHVIHPNNAQRNKSRLMHLVSSMAER